MYNTNKDNVRKDIRDFEDLVYFEQAKLAETIATVKGGNKMKLTNRKIVNDAIFLGSLSQKQLPIKISYALAKNIAKIEKELEIYNSERQKLLDKYAVKGENGENVIDVNNQLKIDDKNMSNWNESISELLDIEIEIDIHKFNKDDLLNSNCEMTPSELMLIDYMIEE